MADMERGYVTVAGRQVHYRRCGTGPAVVMLHDSPRSSRLHRHTMAELADAFTVFALDTPGYGNSDPLGLDEPTIADFARALGEALAALGLERAPLYAPHTGAKIALALAARGGAMPLLVLDGLSIPEQLAPAEFVAAYMRPFRIDDSGAYLAAEWSRTRDMLRWFPWFRHDPAARMAMEAPDAAWMADYGIDLFAAGPHYSDAYGAAMRWDPFPDLLSVGVPTIVAAKSDDVLAGFLDRVPLADNPALRIQRLGAERDEWLAWLRRTLASAARGSAGQGRGGGTAGNGAGYLRHAGGQLRWHRSGSGQPVLILSAPTTLAAHAWAKALGGGRTALVAELPGFDESDALPRPTADAFADVLAALIDAEAGGCAQVLGIGLAAPLAARLAARHPGKVSRLIVDGAPPVDSVWPAGDLCPAIAFDAQAGTHLHRVWHMLRDGEVQWPWHDPSPAASRRLPPLLAGAGLHRALTGVLKQPQAYGDAARAALDCASAADWARVTVPATVLAHADPAHAGAAGLAASMPKARLVARPDDLAEAAELLISTDEKEQA